MSPEEKRILKERIRQFEELENKILYLKRQLELAEKAKQHLIESKQTEGTIESPTIEIKIPCRDTYQYYKPCGFDRYSETMHLLVNEIIHLKFKIQRLKEQIKDF